MQRIALCAVVVWFLGLSALARAAENADPSGTWKWTARFGDQTREVTLKLKLEGDKLSGAILGRNNREIPITDAQFKEGQISFSVTRERNGQKFTTRYSGKLEGDTIKGKQEFERDGQKRERDWQATRAKE